MKKRILSLLMAGALLFTLIPATVYAESSTGTDAGSGNALTEIAAQVQDHSDDPFNYISPKAALKSSSAKSYSAKYDLRDEGLVTPVRFQNPFGTCWGFAAIAAAETSILGDPSVRGDFTSDTLDLSEKHLVYFVSHHIADPDDPQYGEGTHADKGITVADRFNNGGMSFLATNLFASGIGPVLEDDGTEQPTMKYMGSDGSIEFVAAGDKLVPYCYDDEDDWSLPEEYRKLHNFELKESYILPSPAQVDQDTGVYKYNSAGTAAIKEMLSNNRAVQIGFCADTSSPSQEAGDGQYISTNWAHYTYDAEEHANHAVTIVGWDDNYPKTNFVKGHQPPDNGAWLVKNSWGSEEEDFPDKGPGWGLLQNPNEPYDPETNVHTGYFWLSYYDKTLDTPEALEFDRNNTSENDGFFVDSHDYMPPNDVEGAAVDSETKMSNVFKARECQLLEGVSCQTSYPGTKVLNEIYLLPDGFRDPTDGILVATAEGEYEYGGFHKLDLDSPVLIQKGQYYSIVQTQTVDDQYAINMPIAFNEVFSKAMGYNTWVEGVVNKRESYVYADGKWHDYADEEFLKTIFADYLYFITYDNFPIKGYAKLQPDISIRVLGDKQLDLFTNSQSVLRVRFKGHDSHNANPKNTTWKLSEDGSAFFKLTTDKADPTRAVVTALDVGKANLFVTVEGVGTTVIPLSVNKKEMYGYIVYNDSFVYTGKPVVPDYDVLDAAEEKIDKKHYTAKGINNTKCGMATIEVTAKPDDATYTGSMQIEFLISPARAVIKGLSDGNKSLTVTVKDQKASGVESYEVRYRIKGASKWKKKIFKATSNKLVLKGLKNGKKYQVKVRARGKYYEDTESYNVGAYSAVKTSGKIGARPAQPVIRKLKADEGKLTITLKGKKPLNVAKYKVQYRIKGTKKWKTKTFKATNNRKIVIKKLKEGKKYQVRVKAVKANGIGGKYSRIKVK